LKLSEALIQRADAQKRLVQLRQRINQNALIQEGTSPSEDPNDLLKEMDRTLAEFGELVKRINRTNAATGFDQSRSLTDALADRDMLHTEHGILTGLAQAAVHTYNRYTKSEVKYLSTVDVAALQKRIDDLSRHIRELDTSIQAMNWQIDLLD
jgi:cell fate (sporulation/competence/biofilm development) regulator YmcA (YheA/YmcA/DUF963 family)